MKSYIPLANSNNLKFKTKTYFEGINKTLIKVHIPNTAIALFFVRVLSPCFFINFRIMMMHNAKPEKKIVNDVSTRAGL